MKVINPASYIDLTLLTTTASDTDIKNIIEASLKYPFASLCIPPFYVPFAANILKGKRRIGTVIGFPLGYQSKAVKLYEAMDAVKSGADELDVVMNIAAFKSGKYELIRGEIENIVLTNKDIIVKVIIESSYLTDAEEATACKIAIESRAHFVKTSTGFATKGATIGDVKLLVKIVRGKIKVKASGGIKDLDTTLAMINAGASRIGTSSGIQIMEEFMKR
ncbi:MAG: deoxyribose-phosphate aldolase [Deltaproteobacteria bacterium]|nr:deoxyribose-phosphate aldolase [Deltaproteobacteria bacterium]